MALQRIGLCVPCFVTASMVMNIYAPRNIVALSQLCSGWGWVYTISVTRRRWTLCNINFQFNFYSVCEHYCRSNHLLPFLPPSLPPVLCHPQFPKIFVIISFGPKIRLFPSLGYHPYICQHNNRQSAPSNYPIQQIRELFACKLSNYCASKK